jgi:hypothetical protein
MLLSFDQLSTFVPGSSSADEDQLYTPYDDDRPPPRSPLQSTFTRNERHRDLAYSNSYSSEVEHVDDTTSSRHSKRQGNSNRRSNNSSINNNNINSSNNNINQGNIGRVESLRQEVGRGKFFDAQRTGPPSPSRGHHHLGHSRGSKGSGSVGSTDLGYSQVAIGGSRWTNDIHSPGLDNGYGERRVVHSSQSNMAPANGNNSNNNNNSDNFPDDDQHQSTDYHNYDAAPTPTVPVGPRRLPPQPPVPQGAYPPQPSHPPPQTPKPERKKSSKSPRSLYGRAGRSNTLGASSVRSPTDSFGDVSDPRELPPLPAFVNPPAPFPSVPFEKPIPSPPQAPAKERQGFFRRVFGSSKNATSLNQTPPPPSPLGQSEHPSSRGKEYQHIVEQMIRPWSPKFQQDHSRQRSTTPTENTPPQQQQQQQQPPHQLNKKHSFFRRRKKSVSEHHPVPVPPVQTQQIEQVQQMRYTETGPSPVSSLRQVMNPYLRSPGGHPEEYQPYWRDHHQHVTDSDDNHSGDTAGPPPNHHSRHNQTIRSVPPSREGTDFVPSHGRAVASAGKESGYPNSHARALASSSSNHARDAGENSFFQDSSGNEDRGGKTIGVHRRPSKLGYQDEERRPRTSPSSPTHRDMAVQSEIEREMRRLPVVKSIATRAPVPAASDSPQNSPKDVDRTIEADRKRAEIAAPEASTEVTVDEKGLAARDEKIPSKSSSDSADTPWLDPASPEEGRNTPLSLPLEGPREQQRASGSTNNSDYKSASSVPVVQVDNQHTRSDDVIPSVVTETVGDDEDEPTAEDRISAKKIFDGNEETITKARAAAWLGDSGPASLRARSAYMELYDWTNMSILAAMRDLCERFVLRGETQQVDRILGAISRRWCECNPNHGFKHTGE